MLLKSLSLVRLVNASLISPLAPNFGLQVLIRYATSQRKKHALRVKKLLEDCMNPLIVPVSARAYPALGENDVAGLCSEVRPPLLPDRPIRGQVRRGLGAVNFRGL